MDLVLVAAPIVLATVFSAAAIGKLSSGVDDADAWRELGLPKFLNQTWLRRAHPWAELALALALLVAPGVLAWPVALAALALASFYLALIVRLARQDQASCNCFGAKNVTEVGPVLIARNLALVALALLWLVALAWGTPVFALQVATNPPVLALAAVAAVTWLLAQASLGKAPAPVEQSGFAQDYLDAPASQQEGEYLRALIPIATLYDEFESGYNLRAYSARQAHLLLFLSMECGYCDDIKALVPGWSKAIPQVAIKVVSPRSAEEYFAKGDPYSLRGHYLRDVNEEVSHLLAIEAVPAAVLLGTDGLLAGGPVEGKKAVIELVEQMLEQISDAVDTGDLPAEASSYGAVKGML